MYKVLHFEKTRALSTVNRKRFWRDFFHIVQRPVLAHFDVLDPIPYLNWVGLSLRHLIEGGADG